MIDLHAHILPGLDDGAASWDEFLEMAAACVDDGVRRVVATPHMMPDGQYALTAADVLPVAAEAKERLRRAGIPLALEVAGEIYLAPDLLGRVQAGELLTYPAGRRYLLVELPGYEAPPAFTEQVFFDLQVAGITPVVAHPERYLALSEALFPRLVEWVERGVLFQVNGRSLLGESGPRVQRAAERLLDSHMVHLLASDAHGVTRRPPGLAAARARAAQRVGAAMAAALVEENPRRVLAGEPVVPWEIKRPPQRASLLARLLRRS